jgi:WD40 repeat protein
MNKAGTMVNSAVAMIKWMPGSEYLFFAVFKNGTVMVMDKERDDQTFHVPEPANWVDAEFMTLRPHRSAKYNPVSWWKVGDKALTDLCFSPDSIHMAITGSDGKLRIIDYRNERLLDVYSSYFGSFTCVDWSPDGRYILVSKFQSCVRSLLTMI